MYYMKVKVTQSYPTLCSPMDCPWNSPGQNSGVGSLSFLQGIFTSQGSNVGLQYCRWILYQLNNKGSCITNDHNLSCSNNTDLLSGGFAIQETGRD